MRTKLTIVAIVSTCVLVALAKLAAAWMLFAWWGVAGYSIAAFSIIAIYLRFVRPWHSRWGARAAEVARAMPGDDIVANAASTTRSISINCTPKDLWPWLVQIGYGRAGWYSYDWIDNDGKPSARRVVPELQDLKVGDMIEMLPGFGPHVIEVVPDSHFVAADGQGGTWCLAVYPEPGGSRLVSRWRQDWKSDGLGPKFFIALADPGAFIMEQKMLRGIKQRAESHASLNQGMNAGPTGPRAEVSQMASQLTYPARVEGRLSVDVAPCMAVEVVLRETALRPRVHLGGILRGERRCLLCDLVYGEYPRAIGIAKAGRRINARTQR